MSPFNTSLNRFCEHPDCEGEGDGTQYMNPLYADSAEKRLASNKCRKCNKPRPSAFWRWMNNTAHEKPSHSLVLCVYGNLLMACPMLTMAMSMLVKDNMMTDFVKKLGTFF